MTNINIDKIADIVTDNCAVVVVSAVGAISANDTKVTDLLAQLHDSLPCTDLWVDIASRYTAIVNQHCIDIDIESLLYSTISSIVAHNNYHYTISVGEQLSAKIMAKYLGRQYLEADKIVVFDNNGQLMFDQTLANIANIVQQNNTYVMGGFYGSNYIGQRMTFSRGGSDITGALVACALGADIYENWTDVCGLCSANPRHVDCVATVRYLSYNEMQILADCGVGVLNNYSIYPVRYRDIPINIRSIYNKFDCGTLVSSSSCGNQLLSVLDNCIDGLWYTTIVSTYRHQYLYDKIYSCIANIGCVLLSIESVDITTTIITTQAVLVPLYKQLVD